MLGAGNGTGHGYRGCWFLRLGLLMIVAALSYPAREAHVGERLVPGGRPGKYFNEDAAGRRWPISDRQFLLLKAHSIAAHCAAFASALPIGVFFFLNRRMLAVQARAPGYPRNIGVVFFWLARAIKTDAAASVAACLAILELGYAVVIGWVR